MYIQLKYLKYFCKVDPAIAKQAIPGDIRCSDCCEKWYPHQKKNGDVNE